MKRLIKIFDKTLLKNGIKNGNYIFEVLWNEFLPSNWQKLSDKKLIKYMQQAINKAEVKS